jgi:hypothetical protein
MTFCTCVADFLSIVVCRTNERREYPVDNSRIGFNNVEDYLLVSGPERLSNVSEHNALPQSNLEANNTTEGATSTAAVDLSEMSTEL